MNGIVTERQQCGGLASVLRLVEKAGPQRMVGKSRGWRSRECKMGRAEAEDV